MALSKCNPVATDEHGRELVDHGSSLFPMACYHDNPTEIDVGWHWHEEFEVLLVESGECRISISGEEFILQENEGLFINSGILHACYVHGRKVCRFYSIVFHPRLVAGSLDSILWQKYVEPLIQETSLPWIRFGKEQNWTDEASKYLMSAWNAAASENSGYEFEVRNSLSRLILLLENHHTPAQKRPSEKTLRSAKRVKLMLQFMHEHLSEEITLDQIASSASVSRNECLRCFHDILGTSPIQYLKEIRIQKAERLLKQTDMKISDIAMECGFQEMSCFARTFKKHKGTAPSELRKAS